MCRGILKLYMHQVKGLMIYRTSSFYGHFAVKWQFSNPVLGEVTRNGRMLFSDFSLDFLQSLGSGCEKQLNYWQVICFQIYLCFWEYVVCVFFFTYLAKGFKEFVLIEILMCIQIFNFASRENSIFKCSHFQVGVYNIS